MKEKKKILVLTDHMPWGHRSIAKAIYNYLKEKGFNDFDVEYAEVKSEIGGWGDFYAFICRYMPKGNRISHNLMGTKLVARITNKVTSKSIPRLRREINKINPDLIISTYYLHSHSLVKWRKMDGKKFKIWTVVADPRTTDLYSYVKEAELHLVYDEASKKRAIKFGIKNENILITGWWVRPEMYNNIYQMSDIRCQIKKKLGFEDDRPIIFVGGGSLGNSALPRILALLVSVKKKMGVIFNTGTDKVGFSLVEEYIKIFDSLDKRNLVKIKNIGWIDNMAEVLSISDMVLGKAGPNFLFDTIAVQKPFVAITHIGGQEDGNIDLIKEKKIGWVKEKTGEVEKFLIDYLDNRDEYEKKFMKNIRRESMANKNSLSLVLGRIKDEIKQ